MKRDAQPLPGADLEAEQPLGHDGEQHDAAGEDRLDDGDRRHGHRGHVEDPRADGHAHADGEPPRREQRLGRAQRVPHVDRGSSASAPVLVEEAEVRGERAEEREQDADFERHAVGGFRVAEGSGAGQYPYRRRPLRA